MRPYLPFEMQGLVRPVDSRRCSSPCRVFCTVQYELHERMKMCDLNLAPRSSQPSDLFLMPSLKIIQIKSNIIMQDHLAMDTGRQEGCQSSWQVLVSRTEA